VHPGVDLEEDDAMTTPPNEPSGMRG